MGLRRLLHRPTYCYPNLQSLTCLQLPHMHFMGLRFQDSRSLPLSKRVSTKTTSRASRERDQEGYRDQECYRDLEPRTPKEC